MGKGEMEVLQSGDGDFSDSHPLVGCCKIVISNEAARRLKCLAVQRCDHTACFHLPSFVPLCSVAPL